MLTVAKVKHKTPSVLCQAFSADVLIVATLGRKQKTPNFLCRAFYAELFDCSRSIKESSLLLGAFERLFLITVVQWEMNIFKEISKNSFFVLSRNSSHSLAFFA